MESRNRDFTKINKLYLISFFIIFCGKTFSKTIYFGEKYDQIMTYVILSISLLIAYLPFFVENNFGQRDYEVGESLNLDKKDFLSFAILVIFINVFSYFFISGIESSINDLGYTIIKRSGTNKSFFDFLFMFFYSLIFAPLIEELIFRGFILKKLKKHGHIFAIIVSSLLFAFLHGNFSQFISSILLGIFLGYVYLKTGSLKFVIGLHFFNNLYTTIYNNLIFRFFESIKARHLFLLIELFVFSALSFFALYTLSKRNDFRLESLSKSANNKSFRIYFRRITSIIIIFVSLLSMFFSVAKLGG